MIRKLLRRKPKEDKVAEQSVEQQIHDTDQDNKLKEAERKVSGALTQIQRVEKLARER